MKSALRQVLQHEPQAEAHQQGVLDLLLSQLADDVPVDDPVEDQPDDEYRGDDDDERQERVPSERAEGPEAHVAAEHDQLAVSDVEDLEHPEDQGQPHRGDAVDRAREDAEDERLHEGRSWDYSAGAGQMPR